MILYTARFHNRNLRSPGIQSVAISNSVPQWELGFDPILGALQKALSPSWSLVQASKSGHMSRSEFEAHYTVELDRARSRIMPGMKQLTIDYPKVDLAFLCWEDIRKEGVWCHRETFAEWWTKQTGEEMSELIEMGDEQRSMF